MSLNKKQARSRRSARTRLLIKSLGAIRLCVNRSNKHLYAQIISSCGSRVLVSASTLESSFRGSLKEELTMLASAKMIGTELARRAMALGIEKVAFDRSGFKYHGCIKALADASREVGLQF